MPEDCLAVCVLNLRNGNETLTLKRLIDDTVVALKRAVSPAGVSAQQRVLLVLMDIAESRDGLVREEVCFLLRVR